MPSESARSALTELLRICLVPSDLAEVLRDQRPAGAAPAELGEEDPFLEAADCLFRWDRAEDGLRWLRGYCPERMPEIQIVEELIQSDEVPSETDTGVPDNELDGFDEFEDDSATSAAEAFSGASAQEGLQRLSQAGVRSMLWDEDGPSVENLPTVAEEPRSLSVLEDAPEIEAEQSIENTAVLAGDERPEAEVRANSTAVLEHTAAPAAQLGPGDARGPAPEGLTLPPASALDALAVSALGPEEAGLSGEDTAVLDRSEVDVDPPLPIGGDDTAVLSRGDDTAVLSRGDDTAVLERADDTAVLERGDDTAVLKQGDDTAVLARGDETAVIPPEDDTAVLERGEDTAVLKDRPRRSLSGQAAHTPTQVLGGPLAHPGADWDRPPVSRAPAPTAVMPYVAPDEEEFSEGTPLRPGVMESPLGAVTTEELPELSAGARSETEPPLGGAAPPTAVFRPERLRPLDEDAPVVQPAPRRGPPRVPTPQPLPVAREENEHEASDWSLLGQEEGGWTVARTSGSSSSGASLSRQPPAAPHRWALKEFLLENCEVTAFQEFVEERFPVLSAGLTARGASDQDLARRVEMLVEELEYHNLIGQLVIALLHVRPDLRESIYWVDRIYTTTAPVAPRQEREMTREAPRAPHPVGRVGRWARMVEPPLHPHPRRCSIQLVGPGVVGVGEVLELSLVVQAPSGVAQSPEAPSVPLWRALRSSDQLVVQLLVGKLAVEVPAPRAWQSPRVILPLQLMAPPGLAPGAHKPVVRLLARKGEEQELVGSGQFELEVRATPTPRKALGGKQIAGALLAVVGLILLVLGAVGLVPLVAGVAALAVALPVGVLMWLTGKPHPGSLALHPLHKGLS